MLIQNIFSLFSVSEILEKLNRHNLIPLLEKRFFYHVQASVSSSLSGLRVVVCSPPRGCSEVGSGSEDDLRWHLGWLWCRTIEMGTVSYDSLPRSNHHEGDTTHEESGGGDLVLSRLHERDESNFKIFTCHLPWSWAIKMMERLHAALLYTWFLFTSVCFARKVWSLRSIQTSLYFRLLLQRKVSDIVTSPLRSLG